MQLKEGKYETRNGKIVNITKKDTSNVPFKGDNNMWYYENGRAFSDKESCLDLVREYKEKQENSKLTVTEDFILRAHKECSDEFKTEIEELFPDLFLKIGKWYKFTDREDTYLIYNGGKATSGFWEGQYDDGYAFFGTDRANIELANLRDIIPLCKEEMSKLFNVIFPE